MTLKLMVSTWHDFKTKAFTRSFTRKWANQLGDLLSADIKPRYLRKAERDKIKRGADKMKEIIVELPR